MPTLNLGDGRPLIMGILNVTPDSFSDGGRYSQLDAAKRRIDSMLAEGADIIDLGAESTRPGSERVPAEEQLRRLDPLLDWLRRERPTCVFSVDTTRAEVAKAALEFGAACINDISAGADDADLLPLVAMSPAWLVLMHKQGDPKTMQADPYYVDVVAEVKGYLLDRAAAAQRQGVGSDRIVLDPGIGFGKRVEHNLTLLANLSAFVETGFPVLLGTSRKRFMGAVLGIVEPRELTPATVATTALGVAQGVRVFRVHDVRENRQAADVAHAIRNASGSSAR